MYIYKLKQQESYEDEYHSILKELQQENPMIKDLTALALINEMARSYGMSIAYNTKEKLARAGLSLIRFY